MSQCIQLDPQVMRATRQRFDAMLTRAPDQVLRHPEHGIYLERWKSLQNDGSGYYAHVMHRSDVDLELHDHPFDNATILLEGEWLEHLPQGQLLHVRPGDCVIRSAADAHRLELIDGPTKSLFYRGPKIREWGFYAESGWVHNQAFFRQRGYF